MNNKKRRQWITSSLLWAGIVIGLLGTVAVIAQRQILLRGTLNGYPDLNLPPRTPVLGVNADLTQYSAPELEENLDLIADTGFVWVRQVFDWRSIEPEPGVYDWESYDAIVNAAAARGLRIAAVLWGSPGWAASDPAAPPGDLADLSRFSAAFAGRYGDRIDVYQVWDEPNLAAGWGGQPADPIGYAAMLEAVYEPVHQADPGALVLTAGLAPTIETGPDNLSDVLYLRALYENGAASFFDGVAGKPYGFDTGPDDRRANSNLLNFSRVLLLRREMERFGDEGKPLWVSHFGWNALPDGWDGQPSAWGQTSPQAQAKQTIAAYRRALLEWPWSGALILENWQPNTSFDDPRWGFALRDAQGDLSPTATAIREQAELFNSALWPGVYTPLEPLLDYSGEWKFSDLGADFSEANESIVDVPFAGDSLAAIIRRDNYRAYLYVDVDGNPSASLPHDEQGAYLVLTSPDYKPRIEAMPVASGLLPGEKHIAHIEAARGWDQWALVGFTVGRHVNTTTYDLLAVGLLALAVFSTAVLIRRVGGHADKPGWVDRLVGWMADGMNDILHLVLSLASALAVWLGSALTWGGLIPDLTRRLGEGPSLLLTALTAGVFYFSPWLILTLVALVALFLLIYARPAVGLALVMFFTPYYFHPRSLFDRAFSMVELTSLLTLIAWAIHMVADRREQGWPPLRTLWRAMTPLDKAVAAFVGLSILAVSWSRLTGVAVTELRQMVLDPVIVYLVLRTMPFSREERWRIVDMLVLTGVVVTVIGLYQFMTGSNLITAEAGMQRLRSVYNSPNGAALFLERIIPLTAAVVLIGGAKWRRWAYGAAGILTGAAAILTLSKGGLLLGLPAGLAVIVILWGGRRGVIAVIAGIVLEGLALIPLSRIPRFQGLFDITSGTSTSFFRVKLWQSTVQMLRDHPLTGVGLDQFLYEYRGHYILPGAWQEPDLSTPHNFLLSYWVRLGIVGLAVGLWLQVTFWRRATRLFRRFKGTDVELRALAAGLMGGMMAFIAHGLVDEAYYLIDLAFIFFMMLGLIHNMSEEAFSSGSSDQSSGAAAG